LRTNSLLKHVIEGKIEVEIKGTKIRRRRRKQLPYNRKENRRYRNLKDEVLDGTLWRTHFGRGYGHVSRQNGNEIHCVQSTPKEMMPARNTIQAHAQDFVEKDELLLPILKAFAQYTRSLHTTVNASSFQSV
jgi:hypothetical protein